MSTFQNSFRVVCGSKLQNLYALLNFERIIFELTQENIFNGKLKKLKQNLQSQQR